MGFQLFHILQPKYFKLGDTPEMLNMSKEAQGSAVKFLPGITRQLTLVLFA